MQQKKHKQALGTGIRSWIKNIEILHDNLNKPIVNLSLKVIQKITLNISFILSISHSNDNAIAFAVLEEEQ